ncbi:MAG: endonuclease/exonuclease/phosphatase family protein [Candidatus Cloacimonas sp.]|jgi:endonuclease/exonuclease/phosphatase family metal-dependent hydrolase|nr:endonuclease/exonuclease/phosphatase family protein [Candidatus Cloacimonas sp.]
MTYRNVILALILLLVMAACGKNTPLNPVTTDPTDISFGTPTTLDVVSWNLKLFPEGTNLDALAQMIPAINADVIAFQEIMDMDAFNDLAASIPYYNAFVYAATSDYRLAYLYDTRTVTVNDQYTIYNNDSNPFPRPPYVLDITWNNANYKIINNHLKAYGDNVIVENDTWDEEYRRRLACQMLDSYIAQYMATDNVIVLGDMNDQIAEPPEYNVFLSFINKPAEYLFADMPIAVAPTYNTVSYPGSLSHLDHILISNELFADFSAADSYCSVIQAEKWLVNWGTYASTISDHRPIGIRLVAAQVKRN